MLSRSFPLVVFFVLCATSSAYALPIFTSSQCTTSGNSGWNDDPGDTIFVYIEDDAGDELTSCLPSTANLDGISNLQFRNAIKVAMEIWNREGRGAILEFSGTSTAETANSACSDMVKRPAIFVRYFKGCFLPSGGTCQSSSASLGAASSCSNAAEMTIYGDQNSQGNGLCIGTGIIDWQLDGETNTSAKQDLVKAAVHEFGHALDLQHPSLQSSDPTSGHSVMGGGGLTIDRHLYPYDMDCSDDVGVSNHRGIRDLRYAWMGIDDDGVFESSVKRSSLSNNITKNFMSGGYVRDSSGEVYLRYDPDNEMWQDNINLDGSLSFTQQIDFGFSSIEDLFIGPSIMSPLELLGVNQGHRINFNGYETSTITSYVLIDPPPLRYVRSDNYFVTGSGPHPYYECENSTCSSSTKMQSHIPLVSAWDASTNDGITVFVSVDTGGRDSENRSFANYGEIRVHPGVYGTTYNKLREPDVVSDELSAPSDPYGGAGEPEFDYVLKTETAPGVACADDRNDFAYNCLLAWQDRGVPDGQVLYTYFRVDEVAFDIEWEGTIRKRSGSSTLGDVSAAYFEGAFWMAWKDYGTSPEVEWTKTTSTSYNYWSSVAEISSKGTVATAPTFIYTPFEKERGIIWAEY